MLVLLNLVVVHSTPVGDIRNIRDMRNMEKEWMNSLAFEPLQLGPLTPKRILPVLKADVRNFLKVSYLLRHYLFSCATIVYIYVNIVLQWASTASDVIASNRALGAVYVNRVNMVIEHPSAQGAV